MFIKKGKTNWTLVIVVALVAGAVSGGLVVYINDTVKETSSLISSDVLVNQSKTQGNQIQAIAIKDVLTFANNHLSDTSSPRVQTQGTIVDIDYDPTYASIIITDNGSNYILAVVSHADMAAVNSPYPGIVSQLQKNEILGVSGTVSFTAPGAWAETEKTKLEAQNLPTQIGMISVDSLVPAAK